MVCVAASLGESMRVALILFALVSAVGPAVASPLKARNSEVIQLKVGSQRRDTIALRARTEGWRLVLSGTTANGSAEIVDLTPGTPARTLSVILNGDELLLDNTRFVGGHVYRVQLRRGGVAVESGFVYLYPMVYLKDAPRSKEPQRLKFAGDEAAASDGDDTIKPVSKSGL